MSKCTCKYQKIQYKNKKLTLCTNFSSNSKISSKVYIFLFWISISSSFFLIFYSCNAANSFCNISLIILCFLSSASSSNLCSLAIFLSISPPLSCSFMISNCNSAILLIVILCVNLCVHIRKTHYNNNG